IILEIPSYSVEESDATGGEIDINSSRPSVGQGNLLSVIKSKTRDSSFSRSSNRIDSEYDKINVKLEAMEIISIPTIPKIDPKRERLKNNDLKKSMSTASLTQAAKKVSSTIIEGGRKTLFEARFDEHGSKTSLTNITLGRKTTKLLSFPGIHPRSVFVVTWDFMMA
ncbi:hypothetical protein HK096_011286, partial [Nowakowskiella sp. JEL0078]